jgi:SPP1 gp7 family putative phage head morphogenesis protein
MAKTLNFNSKQVAALTRAIYEGTVTDTDLPEDLYFAIAEYLKSGLYDGFGGVLADFEGKELDLLTELRENIYMFSGAKTYQQVREMTDALYEGDNIRPFADFKKDALKIYDKYNLDWARTEYDTSIASGQQGVLWAKIEEQADILPFLTFSAVIDGNTTDECEHMNGITAPVADPIWDSCYPPNHWNCRSTVLQTDNEGKVSSKSEISHAKEETLSEMQDVFKMNVGKDGYVFKPDHPYFDVADKKFAQDNFGLPIPEED